ncbi:MAG: hypothetical protein JW757_10230 [Anaerolineales bacterium]|nr:hypothetical protein [Anaerolineales bacterium]
MATKNTGNHFFSGNLASIQLLIIFVAVLLAGLSIIGLNWSEQLYPAEEFIQAFMTNDLINLLIGLPVLAAVFLLIRGSKLTGLLLLPGAMLYVFYNSIAYVFGRRFDLFSAGHLVLILVCAFGPFWIFYQLDLRAIRGRLLEVIPAKFSGWVLTGFGTLFFFRAVGMFASSLIQSRAIPLSEVGVLVADMVLSVLLFAGGVMLLRNRVMGAAAGLGLLYAASMLFAGLIALLVVQAAINQTAIPFVDILVVASMGSVCFIPFVRYLRACAKSE